MELGGCQDHSHDRAALGLAADRCSSEAGENTAYYRKGEGEREGGGGLEEPEVWREGAQICR